MAMSRNVRNGRRAAGAATRTPARKGTTVAKAKAKAKAKAPKAKRANPASSSSSALPPTTSSAPLSSARPWPAPSHGRASPYQPTQQTGGHYPKQRGNAPPNISGKDWDKLFNSANSVRYSSRPDGTRIQDAKASREDGTTRDFAIEGLISAGRLPVSFIDSNP